MKGKTIISANNIGIGYAKTKHSAKTALYNNISFNLYKGELVCLLGSNGAGKSTLLRTISASQAALSGEILLNNKNVTAYSEKELSRLLGLVLTDKTSTGGLLVRELVELGRYPYTGFFGQLTKEDKDIVQKAMEDVGIVHKANVYVAQLSDGERQKAMIAKALAQECPVVLLDEPTAFLDIESRIEIMNLLHNLAMKKEKTILLSTHDIDMALLLADRLWLLSRDQGLTIGVTEDIVLSGTMDHFFKEDKIVFDRYSGSFLPNRKNDKKVFLDANDHLFHWTKNMIERNGYSVTNNEEDSLFSVSVNSVDNIRLKMIDGTIKELNSYEQLAEYL